MRRQLAWISAGYAAALAAAALSVWVRNLFVSPADQLAMSGMLAAGDSIQFVLVAGALGLVPTFFLLRLLAQGWPRALAWALLAVAATGPLGWLVMAGLVKFPVMPRALSELVGLALVLLVFPRAVASPVVFAALALALVLARDRRSRALLTVALSLEGVPLALVALHFLRTIPR